MDYENTLNQSYVHSNHVNIYFESYGKGIPMLLIHGNMQSSSYFNKQVEFFKNRFNVIVIDSRGHGKSDFGTVNLTLGLLAEDVVNVINALHLEQLIIMGFSDGGNIALKLAHMIPERLIAVVAVGANSNPSGLKNLIRIPNMMLYKLFKLLINFKAFESVKWVKRKTQLIALMILDPNISKEQMQGISVPVLILTGQYDLIHLHHSQMMFHMLPNSKLEIIKNSGHNLLKTHAKVANEKILNFLKNIKVI